MLGDLNKIKNGDFSEGVRKPKAWRWLADSDAVDWRLVSNSNNGDLGGVQINSRCDESSGVWVQSFRPKKNQNYRIETVVSCDCNCDGSAGGLVLSLVPTCADGSAGEVLRTAPLRRARHYTLRCSYKTPPDVKEIELRIGLEGVRGFATVHRVGVAAVIDSELKSHPWAITALPCANPAPLEVKSAVVFTADADRPLMDILRVCLGDKKVSIADSKNFTGAVRSADAVFLPDAKAPSSCRSVRALKSLAKNKIVIVSLQAFAEMSDEHVLTKLIEQADDPLHARVRYANFVTSAMALHDIIPFGGRRDHSTVMTQRQFRTNRVFDAFCKEHGFDVLLDSVTDSESTSEKPIALIHHTDSGAVIVMDVEPAEALPSSLEEPTIARQLLVSALGKKQPTMGQYTACARTITDFRHHLCDMVDRFPPLAWAQGLGPDDLDELQLINVGSAEATIGSPVPDRPLVLIRSGFSQDDLIGAYGVMSWLKHLVRKAPYDSPYAKTLASVCRVAWIPLSTPGMISGGWKPEERPELFPIDAEFEPGSIAAIIDVAASDTHEVTVTAADKCEFSDVLAGALPSLAEQTVSGRHFYRGVPAGESLSDQSPSCWGKDDLRVSVKIDADAFQEGIHYSAREAGANVIRLTVPCLHSDQLGNSIWQTDWTAVLIEEIIGLLMGMVVVNRDGKKMKFKWPAVLEDLRGSAVLRRINNPDADLPLPAMNDGCLVVPPAHAVIAMR